MGKGPSGKFSLSKYRIAITTPTYKQRMKCAAKIILMPTHYEIFIR